MSDPIDALLDRVVRRFKTKPPPTRIVFTPVMLALACTVGSFVVLMAVQPPFVRRKDEPLYSAVVPALAWSLVLGCTVLILPLVRSASRG
jgi:hypothetical protein